MDIIDVKWTPRLNLYIIHCEACDRKFEHRSDRWTVRCPCGNKEKVNEIREKRINFSIGDSSVARTQECDS